MPVNNLRKNTEFSQFARTCNSTGNRQAPVIGAVLPNYGTELLTDNHGRLLVRLTGPGGFLPVNDTSVFVNSGALVGEYAPNGILPLTLLQLTGFISAGIVGVNYFIQLFNTAVAIVAGAVPVWSMLVPQGGTFSYQPTQGRNFPVALRVGLSTTPATFTAAGALAWFNSEFFIP